ncbi:hypothetical protein I4U23_000499 [Adineta vaga]|nr:hypothetical protein I4U23_000499 [Adineta vaga]
MNRNDIDMTSYVRRTPTPLSSFILLPHYREISSNDLRSRQEKYRHSSHRIHSRVYHHETKNSSYHWQRYSDKISQVNQAPDVAYRNTYLHDISDIHSKEFYSRLPSTSSMKSNHLSTESFQSKSQSNTMYDYIRNSIRQIEQQRQFKRDLSLHVRRPQNEDTTLRQILTKRRSSSRISHSKDSSTEQTASSLFDNDSTHSQTIMNYIHHLRLVQLERNKSCKI